MRTLTGAGRDEEGWVAMGIWELAAAARPSEPPNSPCTAASDPLSRGALPDQRDTVFSNVVHDIPLPVNILVINDLQQWCRLLSHTGDGKGRPDFKVAKKRQKLEKAESQVERPSWDHFTWWRTDTKGDRTLNISGRHNREMLKMSDPFLSPMHCRKNAFLTRALMGSGELHVLMGGWPKRPPPPSVSSKVRVVE